MINIPNLPDNLGKVFFSISIVLLGFSFYSLYFPSDEYKDLKHKLGDDLIKVEDEEFGLLEKRKALQLSVLDKVEKISQENNTESPLLMSNDTLIVNENATNIVPGLEDSISKFATNLKLINLQFIHIGSKKQRIQNRINELNDDFSSTIGSIGGLILGLFFLFTGLDRWQREVVSEKTPPGEKLIIEYELLCESCARNFTYYLGRGTDKNGEESKLFCADCYKDGEFTDYLTDENIAAYKTKIIKSRKFGKDRRRIKNRLKSLVRWKTDEFEKLS